MAELDKKIQKAQTDLVQSVLDAQEKKNLERVDMLVTNAIKQLKMSRFKPDLATCLGIVYLARISPKIFLQSTAIRDSLKSLLRRDAGPSNIKAKNDIVLPVLAANILLACCDCTEVKAIILGKIEQWLSSNQKISDLLQHLLATICMKCTSDAPTLASVLELRQHWLQYLEDNYHLYGPVPLHLSIEIRKLLHTETSTRAVVEYLKFLNKHDRDSFGLSSEMSEFILRRPMTLDSMLREEEFGPTLSRMMLSIFIKLMKNVKGSTQELGGAISRSSKPDIKSCDDKVTKSEPAKAEMVKSEMAKDPSSKNESTPKEKDGTEDEDSSTGSNFFRSLYIRFSDESKTITLSRATVDAILTLLALVESRECCREEFNELLGSWMEQENSSKLASIYEDFGLKSLYDLPDKLRQKLVLSANSLLVEKGLQGANTSQLIGLLQTFGSPMTTVERILKLLESSRDVEQIKSEIKDISYFYQLMQFYSCMGSAGANDLQKKLECTTVN